MDRMTAQLPNNLKQWTYIIIAACLGLLVALTGLATAQHLSDEQFITSDELQDDAQQLKSYTAETVFLYHYTEQKSAPRPYVQAYASSLQDATDSVTQKLSEHPHDFSIDAKVQQTIEQGNTLSELLHELATQPTAQMPKNYADTLEDLTNKLQKTGDSL
jgi:uncharacterized membrane-anchored protein YhcB (DUF1043 family)